MGGNFIALSETKSLKHETRVQIAIITLGAYNHGEANLAIYSITLTLSIRIGWPTGSK